MTAVDPFSVSGEFDDAFGSAPGSTGAPNRSLRGLAWGVLRRPRATLTEIAERPGKRWVVPILALVVAGTAAAVVMIPSTRAAAREAAMAQLERSAGSSDATAEEAETQAAVRENMDVVLQFTGIVTVIRSIASPFIAVLVLSAVLHLVGTILGGQQSYGQMLAVISWARLPLVFQEVLRLLFGLSGGYDERMNGLAGLVPANHVAGPVLGEISLWNLWSLALAAVAVGVVSHVSRAKAVGAVVVVVLLRVLLGEVGVAVARFTSGFGG